MKINKIICFTLVFVFTLFGVIVEMPKISANEETNYNVIDKSIEISYDTNLENECEITSEYQVTKTSHWVGNWGSYDGYKFVKACSKHIGGVMYNYLGVESGQTKMSRFYTMINNFEKGTVKITFMVDKITVGDLIDLSFSFYDVISKKQVCFGDLTDEYNALSIGKNQAIFTYVDANYIGSIDSIIVSTKADTASASYVLSEIKMEFGKTESSTADGYFRGLDNGFNIVFDKLTRKNISKNFLAMPINGFSTENSINYDSGAHGSYGFNNGKIVAYNNELGEYLSFENGNNLGDNINGIWLKFPLDVSREKIDFSLTFMKAYEGECAEIKFEFLSAAGKDSRSIVITNDSGLPDGKGLKDISAGQWVTVNIDDFDISAIEEFDSLGIWVDLSGESKQAIYMRNASIYYDECGAERKEILSDSIVDGLILSSTNNVTIESDYKAKEYLRLSLNDSSKNLVVTRYVDVLPGKYKLVLSLKKDCELNDNFTLRFNGINNGQIIEKISTDLSEKIKDLGVGKWSFIETIPVELTAGEINELSLIFDGEAEILLESLSFIRTEEYLEPSLSLAVDNVLVRDFTALNGMGMDEYDFSLNTFPEIGNWSSTFSNLLSQGQKVIYDDGIPVMKIYRRTPTEIEQAKVDYNWPEGNYYPATKSHFFITAPINVGYVEIEVSVKKCSNFKGTSEFSLTGYTGKEPWWKLVDFTEELQDAPVGEWVTFRKTVYLPEAIDSVMVRVETRFEDSDLLLKEIKLTTKADNASGFYDATNKADIAWNLSALNGISSVKVDDKELSNNDYEFKNNQFILKQAFLDTLPNGSIEVEITDGTNLVKLSVSITKVKPVLDDSISYTYSKKNNLVIDLNTKNSGISFIELNGLELEMDVDYEYDSETNKLTLFNSVFKELEEGEYTLNVKTRAGNAEATIILEKNNYIGLIVGISATILVLSLACGIIIFIKKKGAIIK